MMNNAYWSYMPLLIANHVEIIIYMFKILSD